MHYTKEQIELLGIRPRERKYGKDGKCDLLPCEARECKAVVKDLLKSDELWEYWRLIPFEEGYACQRRKEFERWIADEVYNMWWDIGIPKFHEDGSWSCDCGWWPYLKTRYLDVCWMQVGNALIDMDEVAETAVKVAERSGIVFLDEIDKVAVKGNSNGADVSREGVQRDILPIVEGSQVSTKYGPVKTDHVLFIAAGAFHIAKPSDLIPELQGRFPIRVELKSLRKEDFERILTEPQNALIKQYQAMLATEGVELEFKESAISRIAQLACDVNEQAEDIGARRLHTLLEKLLEDVSFDAPELQDKHVVIDEAYVDDRLHDIVQNHDLSQFIL